MARAARDVYAATGEESGESEINLLETLTINPKPKNMNKIRIIDGKRFNLETATEIAHCCNGLGTNDFRNLSETLYRTPKGVWFLVGQGGALTVYAESCGNATCGGDRWIPYSSEQAFEWLERHHKTHVLETYFSDQIQDA